jgi:hypothetical protein
MPAAVIGGGANMKKILRDHFHCPWHPLGLKRRQRTFAEQAEGK